MRTIAQVWAQFDAKVLVNAGEVQRREMRRAFYAGFHSCLVASLDIARESRDNDDLGATMMERLSQECLAFVDEIKAGRA